MSSRKPTILLINPWITDFAAFDFWSKPLGLLSLAAVLRQAGAEVYLVDCMDRQHPAIAKSARQPKMIRQRYGTGKYVRQVIPKPAVFANIPRYFARYGLPMHVFRTALSRLPQPDAVLVTSGMTYWYPGVHLAIAETRRMFGKTPIFLGGIYATLLPGHARTTSGADVVIAGEAENCLIPSLQAVLPDLPLEKPHYADLDSLPAPAWDLYPRLAYAVIQTSRGCPLRCSFCASDIVSGAFRMRRPERVMEELTQLVQKHGVRDIAFYDDALLTNWQKHLLPILQQVRKAGLEVRFHTPNGLQCKYLTAEVAKELFASGFRAIRLSLESANEQRQEFDMGKKVSAVSFAAAVRNLYSAGFSAQHLDAYVMMALPEQPLAEVLQSIAFAHAQGVGVRLAAYSPIPGTKDFQRAVSRGWFPEDADPLLTNNSTVPIRAPHTTYETYSHVALLVKDLNAHLQRIGAALEPEHELLQRLQGQFTAAELYTNHLEGVA